MATYQQLKTRAEQVRDEQTIGGNTALRVGQLLCDMVDKDEENADSIDNLSVYYTGTQNNPIVETLNNPQGLHWLQSPIVALVSMGEDLDGDAGAVVQEGDLYYYNHSGYQIFQKGNSSSLPGTGYKARQKVMYLNKYTGKLYEWTGSIMSEITLAGTGGGGGGGGGDITVDSSLSSSSRNPVQNRVITAALAGKQATISDLSTIRTGAGKGATALQPSDVSVESPSTPDGTVTINVGSNAYSINLNHSHPQYLKYQLLADEAAYTALATKDSGTLYLIPVTAS